MHNDQIEFSENTAVEKVNEIDNIAVETSQNKIHREKEMEKKPTSSATIWDNKK